jgi:hypothetical protein
MTVSTGVMMHAVKTYNSASGMKIIVDRLFPFLAWRSISPVCYVIVFWMSGARHMHAV